MENREFSAYGYQCDNSLNKLIGTAIAAVFVTIPCAASISRWFLLLLLVPVAIIVYIKRSGCSRPLLIGSRYLILGNGIIYYRNVTGALLDKTKQTLTITSGRSKKLVISAEKFPTNARKPEKVRINKSAKFEKVSAKIIARLGDVPLQVTGDSGASGTN